MAEKSLLLPHPERIMEPDPNGPPCQRGAIFQPAVVRHGKGFLATTRVIETREAGVPGAYFSEAGVMESPDGIHWTLWDNPLNIPKTKYGKGLGHEETGIFEVDEDNYGIAWNEAELQRQGDHPLVRIMGAIVSKDSLDKPIDARILMETYDPAWMRLKGLTLFPETLPDGKRPFIVTSGADTPFSSILYNNRHTVQDIFRAGESPDIVTPDELARMFSTRDNVLIPPIQLPNRGLSARRGAEAGPAPIRAGEYLLWLTCGADFAPTPTWAIDAYVLDGKTHKPVGHLPGISTPDQYDQTGAVVKDALFIKSQVRVGDEVWAYSGIGDVASVLARGKIDTIVDRALDAGYEPQKYPH